MQPGERLLVGVSGGPDSTCLLLVLGSLRSSLGLELHAAYFDHGLRGAAAAERERRYLRTLAHALELPLVCGAGDVRAHARAQRRSLEESARELRYRFLAEAARGAGCRAVAVGHTRDDQSETVLLRILRGSGLRGLAAMAPAAPWPVRVAGAPRLVRPLLALSRQETERCCREAALRPLRDPTNRSRAHLRNRVRHELLPLLRRYNPRVDEALVRLADAAAADVELLEELAAGALQIEEPRAGEVRLRRRPLRGLPPALQRHAVRLALARLLGDARGVSEHHVRAVLRANEGGVGARLDLSRRVRALVRRDALVLTTRPLARAETPAVERALPVPGDARFGSWRVQARLLRRRPADLASSGHCAFVDADACGPRLRVRRRRPGDRFQPLGLPRPKKLQDVLVDGHVPREERDGLPLVCGEGGIVWVAGQRPAEWAKVTPETRRVLRLEARRARS